MTLDLDHIEELAKAATPGPWKRFNLVGEAHEVCRADDYATGGICVPHRKADAAFIAACDPTTILALIEELRGLRAFATSVNGAINSGDGSYRP